MGEDNHLATAKGRGIEFAYYPAEPELYH